MLELFPVGFIGREGGREGGTEGKGEVREEEKGGGSE